MHKACRHVLFQLLIVQLIVVPIRMTHYVSFAQPIIIEPVPTHAQRLRMPLSVRVVLRYKTRKKWDVLTV